MYQPCQVVRNVLNEKHNQSQAKSPSDLLSFVKTYKCWWPCWWERCHYDIYNQWDTSLEIYSLNTHCCCHAFFHPSPLLLHPPLQMGGSWFIHVVYQGSELSEIMIQPAVTLRARQKCFCLVESGRYLERDGYVSTWYYGVYVGIWNVHAGQTENKHLQ